MRKLGDLKVPELHDELAKVGLSKKGKKAELVERLTEYIVEQGNEPDKIDFDVPYVLVDMKNSSGAMESEAEAKTTINQVEEMDNEDAKGVGEVVVAKEFVLTKPDSNQREDDEVQVIHQTDEPIPEEEKFKFDQMYPTGEPMDGFDGPIMINSSQSSQESNNTLITSTDEGDESMEIETKVPDIEPQAEKATSRKASDNETEEVVARKEEERPEAEKSEAKESDVDKEDNKDSPKPTPKEIQPKEPVEMDVKETQRDPGTVLLTGFSGQRQVNNWGTQVPLIRSDTESSGFESEARPLAPDPSENSGHDGDDEWAIDENNNYDDSEGYQNTSSEESSECESTTSEDEILERINYMEAENMEPFLSSTSINFYRENHSIKRENCPNAWGMIEDELDRCVFWAEQFSPEHKPDFPNLMNSEDIVEVFYSQRQMKDRELKEEHIKSVNQIVAHNEELRRLKAQTRIEEEQSLQEQEKLEEQERIEEQERVEEQERIMEKKRKEEEQRLKKERRYRRCKRKLEF